MPSGWFRARRNANCPRADGRDRTGDIRFTRAVLYQLSYVGVARGILAPSASVVSGFAWVA